MAKVGDVIRYVMRTQCRLISKQQHLQSIECSFRLCRHPEEHAGSFPYGFQQHEQRRQLEPPVYRGGILEAGFVDSDRFARRTRERIVYAASLHDHGVVAPSSRRAPWRLRCSVSSSVVAELPLQPCRRRDTRSVALVVAEMRSSLALRRVSTDRR